MPLHISATHNDAMRAHAQRDYPHECCGFLVGTIDGDTVILRQTQAAGNTRTDSPRNRFEIDPGELVKVDRAARLEHMGVVGFYHSHPDAPAVPSLFDREHAWPGYCYVIISVQSGHAQDMNNWRLTDDRAGFTPDPITITETPITQET